MSLKNSSVENALHNLVGLEENTLEDVSDALFAFINGEEVGSVPDYVEIINKEREFFLAAKARKLLFNTWNVDLGFNAMKWFQFIQSDEMARQSIMVRYPHGGRLEEIFPLFLTKAQQESQFQREKLFNERWIEIETLLK